MNGQDLIKFLRKSSLKMGLIFTAIFLLSGCSNSDQQEETDFEYRTSLKSFSSCDELTNYIRQTEEQESRLSDYFYAENIPQLINDNVPVFEDSWTVSAASDLDSSLTNGDPLIASYTSTNNQVSGVDEGDFVKTDGNYTYVLNGGYLVIFDSWPAEQTNELSRTSLAGTPLAVFVNEDIAWVVSRLHSYSINDQLFSFEQRTNLLTEVRLFDISNRAAPVLQRQITLEGSYVDARKIGSNVHMVMNTRMDFSTTVDAESGFDIEALLPVFNDKSFNAGNTAESVELISGCNTIFRPETANGTGTVSVISFNLEQPQSEIQRQTILSNTGLVYANTNHLYIASTEDNFWAWLPVLEGFDSPKPGTTIHKFSLAGSPAYVASGRVDGYLINQFAMDEDNGLLRVVTSTGNWWSNDVPQNSLYILQQSDNKLEQRSVLTGLGKEGDRIYAVRFQGDQGFLVTFRLIDPLYTLDLSDPDNPRVAGELEVPGFSTYLHPIEPGLLLAVGRSVTNNSIDLSLFDTSDFSNPVLLHKKTIGMGTYSEAEYDHKAFTWDPQLKMLALPVTRWQANLLPTNFSDYNVFNGLQLYQVNRETGFTLFGEVDHSEFYVNDTAQYGYYPQAVKRSFFINDTEQNSYLYSISYRGLKVNSISDLVDELAALPLPAYDWDNILFTY